MTAGQITAIFSINLRRFSVAVFFRTSSGVRNRWSLLSQSINRSIDRSVYLTFRTAQFRWPQRSPVELVWETEGVSRTALQVFLSRDPKNSYKVCRDVLRSLSGHIISTRIYLLPWAYTRMFNDVMARLFLHYFLNCRKVCSVISTRESPGHSWTLSVLHSASQLLQCFTVLHSASHCDVKHSPSARQTNWQRFFPNAWTLYSCTNNVGPDLLLLQLLSVMAGWNPFFLFLLLSRVLIPAP